MSGGGPMIGSRCTVCNHQQKTTIEAALSGGRSKRDVAKDFGLGHDAMNRHVANHMTPTAPTAPGQQPLGWQPPAGSTWKEKMEALAKALETGAVRSDVAAQLRLTYKDLDDAGDGGPTAVQVSDVAGLAEFMGDLLDVLDDHPQIRELVVASMKRHGLLS